jgi:uncharacterized DUF497 family protein
MIVWTDYFKYRASLRGFNLIEVENILIFSDERYFDTATGRNVVVGKHGGMLVVIPFVRIGDVITPVTIHATTRQQINFRLKNGRFSNE